LYKYFRSKTYKSIIFANIFIPDNLDI
jgi:hypothetical protein